MSFATDSKSIFSQLPTGFIPKESLPSLSHLAALVFLGFPFAAVVLNIAYQLFWPKDPTLPPVVFHYVPWIGSAVSYGMDPYKFMFAQREKYGDLFTFVLIGRKMTVGLGPKGNDMIMGGKLNQVSAEEAYTHLTTPVFGKDVVYDCPNHVLMEQKKFVKFGLSLDNLKAYIPMITDEVTQMLASDPHFAAYNSPSSSSSSSSWGSFPALKTLSELTILTASRTLQGKEVRAALDKTFAHKYEALDKGFTPLNFMFPNLPLPSYWNRDKAHKEMSDFYIGIIESRREGLGEHEHDMLASLSTQTYKDGRPLSDREIAHMMIALLMAGQHTSSATSSWTLLELASRPDVCQQLYDEQVRVLGQGDGIFRPLEFDDIKELTVLDSCIRETLRIHAPIHSIMRKVIGDIPVPQSLSAPSESGSYVIPKGHFVMACPGVAQMDPMLWKDSKTWVPSRWTDKDGFAGKAGELYDSKTVEQIDYGFGAISKGTQSPYQPFGAGRHRCIGESFAYVQLSTILCAFIQRMEFKYPEGKTVPATDFESMVVLPKKPDDILFRRRANFKQQQ